MIVRMRWANTICVWIKPRRTTLVTSARTNNKTRLVRTGFSCSDESQGKTSSTTRPKNNASLSPLQGAQTPSVLLDLSHLTDATPSTRARKSSPDVALSIPNGSASSVTGGPPLRPVWPQPAGGPPCEQGSSPAGGPPPAAAKMTKRRDSPSPLPGRHITRVRRARGRGGANVEADWRR